MKFYFKGFLSALLMDLYETDDLDNIIILDEKEFLSKYFKKQGDLLSLYSDKKTFSIKKIEEKDNFLALLRDFNFSLRNLLIYTTNKKLYNELLDIRNNDENINFHNKQIYFQNILNYVSKNQFSNDFWDKKLEFFKPYLPKICKFLSNNLVYYRSVFKNNTNNVLKNELLLYIFFKDIPSELYEEEDETQEFLRKKYYILEKVLWHGKEIEELSNSSAIVLYKIFKNYLNRVFSSDISKLIIHYIENTRSNDFIKIFIAIIFYKDLRGRLRVDDFVEFINEITPFLDGINIKDKYVDGSEIFNDTIFIEFSELLYRFFTFEVNSDRINWIKPLISYFEKAKLIVGIEKNSNFFNDRLDIDYKNIREVFRLTKIKSLYSGIINFNKILFNVLFNINTNDLTRRSKLINILAQYIYFIDQFKENVYYKIKLREYVLHYRFLKNIIRLFLFLRELDCITQVEANAYNLDGWKELYNNYLLPIDNLCWSSFENSRLFWTYDDLPKNMYLLSENVIKKVKEFNIYFLDFLKINYQKWVQDKNAAPISVVNVIKNFYSPDRNDYIINNNDYFLFLIIDCCRVDIWELLRQYIFEDFPQLGSKSIVGLSILPTGTKWARRALFTGNYPYENNYFSHNNEGMEFFQYIKNNFSSTFPIINSLTNSDIEQFYTVNCELLDNNNNAIQNIYNNLNLQCCIFNFADIIAHNFEISMNNKLLKTIYDEKIKPLIRSVLENKSNPIIFFGTDHGIVKCRNMIDWNTTSFNEHWNHKVDYNLRKNRFFVAKSQLVGYHKTDLLKIENDYNKWGLKAKFDEPWITPPIDIKGYYFGISYDDLLGKYGENSKKYAHGGVSFFEIFIPFAILSKDIIDIDKPRDIFVEFPSANNSIIIKNPNPKPIKKLFFDFYIRHYHYIFQNLTINPSQSIELELNLSGSIDYEYDYKYTLIYSEKKYKHKSWIN